MPPGSKGIRPEVRLVAFNGDRRMDLMGYRVLGVKEAGAGLGF
jgi:hypothetical protein